MVFKQKITLILLLVVGTILQVLPVIRSGLSYSYGYGFWGPNGHDGIWHLSLVNHIDNPLYIEMPIFSGSKLVNYHPFFDIMVHYISLGLHIPSSTVLFQVFPIISSFVFLYLSFYLGRLITKSYSGGLILAGLSFTANSFGWIVELIKTGTLGGESLFWAMQSPSNQINPPYNLSLIFLSLIFIILIKTTPKKDLDNGQVFTLYLLLILLPITKAYSAIVGFGFFGIFALVSLIKHKKLKPIALMLISLISAIFVFKIYNPISSNLLIYKPFWFVNSMIESPDRFYIPYLANMRYALESTRNIGPKILLLWLLWLITFTIFLVGNFAWRLLGVFSIFSKQSYIKSAIFLLICINIAIPTFFIQSGTSWNTIQFLYYSLFLSNILLTIYLQNILPTARGKLILIIVFATNIIGLIGMLPNYTGKIPPAAIPTEEMVALEFLSKQQPGTVLTAPYDSYLKTNFKVTPIPLYAYETTSYVSAYSKQSTFVDDYMNLQNSGFDADKRIKMSTDFFLLKNINQDRGFLVNNNISYIYVTGFQRNLYKFENTPDLYLSKIFSNQETTIYKVLK